jgi:chitin disaccharide deacetylase
MNRDFKFATFLPLFSAFLLAQLVLAQQHAPVIPAKTLQQTLGYPASARLLIIHADDLGMSHSVNRATFEALDKGWVTSASILVPCPWFPEVARWAHDHPDADLGIHQALNSEWTGFRWGPVSSKERVSSLLDPDGYLPLDTPEVVKNAKPAEVEEELRAQIDRARAVGIHLTHLDSHMGALFESSELFAVYQRMGRTYSLPILQAQVGSHAPHGIMPPSDEVVLQKVLEIEPGVSEKDWLDTYKKQLAPLEPGVYQLIVHLAYDDDEMRGATWDHPDWGAAWRQHDLDMVKSPEFRQFLKEQGFVLVTWKELAERWSKAVTQARTTTLQ